ncbi:MAG: RNA polymerase factor sigma-54 [Syntrophorhabdaceae bacterium]|nr:RNA polymerase factor sigma-54 [Syntrophorhabdaceae bacterium]MDD4195096.1 RNA polymerase factor sigma-54 [Syntrophorhabdaceae bacterium]HOC46706.1 RNA polymerase factor sigma-54 [Syntrophorhabdaceae bacterium]
MLELKQTQKLSPVLTQQLQQAIKLLQLSKLELVEAIELEMKENPILEIRDEEVRPEPEETQDDKKEIQELLDRYSPSEDYFPGEEKEAPDYENMVRKTYNLRDHLRWQIGLSDFDPRERVVAEWIIENIDDNGYLVCSLDEIARDSGFSLEALEPVLRKVQKLDPAGVGARDLKECILIQYELSGQKDPVFYTVVSSHFDLIQRNNLKGIAKATGFSIKKIKEILERIKSFDPKPGRNFSDEFISYIVPDVYVAKGEEGYEIALNNDDIPELRMSRYYLGLATDRKVSGETKRYIKNKMKQAEWFIKSIQQRQRTLFLVAESIVNFQMEFFDKGLRSLKPLILKDVAQDVGVHESTVSRITTSKYMSTPHGVYEMKFFFPTSINTGDGDSLSTNVVMDLIAELVKKEDKKKPLTDDEIARTLKSLHDINIARRTVAKYREILNIRSSRERMVVD